MDLLKQSIHMDRKKCVAGTQITLENDVNIPDNKPDAESVVLSRGTIVITDSKSSDNHVTLKGKLQFALLIQSDLGGLYSVNGEIPFEEQVYMEGASAADTVDITSSLEDMTVDLINSRKLSVQAVAGFKLCVDAIWDEDMVTGIMVNEDMDGEVECSRKRKDIAQIAIQKKDIFRMKEELELPQNYPNITELVWHDVQLLNVEFKLLEEKITIQGSAQVFLIYESEGEEGRLKTYETTIPFGGTIDCYGCKESMIPAIRFEIGTENVEVRPDFDGESRVVGLELILNMDIKMYEEDNMEYVEDAYGIEKEIELTRKDSTYKKILLNNNDKLKISGKLEAPKVTDGILQILHSDAMIQVDELKEEEGKIIAEGAIRLQVLLSTGESEKPYTKAEGYLPFTYETELPSYQDKCSFELQPALSTLMVSLSGSGDIEAKAVIIFNLIVFEDINLQGITEMRVFEADQERRNKLPGIIGYMVQEGDELWEIGKRYYVPVSQILEFNNLSGESVRAGDKLLIVRQGRAKAD